MAVVRSGSYQIAPPLPRSKILQVLKNRFGEDAGALNEKSCWDDKQMLRAGLQSGLTLLRRSVELVAQAVATGQEDGENESRGRLIPGVCMK